MSDNRKYYYLKLKENYFDDDSIVLLESMQDGVLYSNILLKLYLKSLKHGGRLQLDENIPYTAQMIATITRQQIGTVERALQIFLKLGLVEVLDSGTFYMSNIELLIGQSSTEAERKRAARLQNKALSAPRTNGGHLSDIRLPEIEIKREIEKGQAARAYVENWKEAYKNNTGLLLFGDVGTGKSFFAGCIANALLDRDVPVLMTNFPTILNRLRGMFSEDRAEFIASFDEYDLLIIDDLGVERSTGYAIEQMFFVIDSRYRSRRPMIITTNLKLSELKNPPDLAHARIYARILERCAPILFDGKNFREENAGATKQAAKDIVNCKHD